MVVGISVDDDAGLPAFVDGEGDRMAYTVAVDKVLRPVPLLHAWPSMIISPRALPETRHSNDTLSRAVSCAV